MTFLLFAASASCSLLFLRYSLFCSPPQQVSCRSVYKTNNGCPGSVWSPLVSSRRWTMSISSVIFCWEAGITAQQMLITLALISSACPSGTPWSLRFRLYLSASLSLSYRSAICWSYFHWQFWPLSCQSLMTQPLQNQNQLTSSGPQCPLILGDQDVQVIGSNVNCSKNFVLLICQRHLSFLFLFVCFTGVSGADSGRGINSASCQPQRLHNRGQHQQNKR